MAVLPRVLSISLGLTDQVSNSHLVFERGHLCHPDPLSPTHTPVKHDASSRHPPAILPPDFESEIVSTCAVLAEQTRWRCLARRDFHRKYRRFDIRMLAVTFLLTTFAKATKPRLIAFKC